MLRSSCAGQFALVQRVAASSSRRTASPQDGQTFGISVWQSVRRPLCHIHADDLRDDVSRLLHKHGISDADVALMDIIDIVERRGGNGRTGKTHRRKDRALALVRTPVLPTWTEISMSLVAFLSGREFVGYRPFGRAGVFTDLGAFGEIVRLDDDAVDIKGKGLRSSRRLCPILRDDSVLPSERAYGRESRWKPCAFQIIESLRVWEENVLPSILCTLKTKISSLHAAAVTRESSCRSDPAAALRGLANSGFPASSCRPIQCLKAA